MAHPDINKVKEAMISLFPNDEYRKTYLSLFFEALNKANSYGSNKWGAYYYNEGVRLLVGNLIVLTIHKNGIWLSLDKQLLNEMEDKRILLENSGLWHWETGDYSEYKPVPSMNGYYVPSCDGSDIWPMVRVFHFKYIENVANKYGWLNIKSQSKHSDKLLSYLKNELGLVSVPFPNYGETEPEIAEQISSKESNLFEGAIKQIMVNAYERNPTARKECLEKYGFKCSVCGFDFEEVYGEIGIGYIHVHHLKPLNEINGEYKVDPINDLRPVCPNCHSMLHKAKFSIEQLREKLRIK